MNAFMPFIEQALIQGVMTKKAPFMRKNKFGLGLMVLSGLLFCAALVFSFISGYGWLLVQFTQPIAALIVAGFILGGSVLAALAGFLVLKKKDAAPAFQAREISEIMAMITDALGDELAEPIKDNPKTAMLIAGTAGFVAGDRLN